MLKLTLNAEEEKALASVLFALKEIVAYHSFREGKVWTEQVQLVSDRFEAAIADREKGGSECLA